MSFTPRTARERLAQFEATRPTPEEARKPHNIALAAEAADEADFDPAVLRSRAAEIKRRAIRAAAEIPALVAKIDAYPWHAEEYGIQLAGLRLTVERAPSEAAALRARAEEIEAAAAAVPVAPRKAA